jgi:hypothetical protein
MTITTSFFCDPYSSTAPIESNIPIQLASALLITAYAILYKICYIFFWSLPDLILKKRKIYRACPTTCALMTPVERSDGQSEPAKPFQPLEGLAMIVRPTPGEQPQLQQTPDGGFTLFLRGEIQIAYRPPTPEATKSPVRADSEPSGTRIPEPPPEARIGQSRAVTEQSERVVGNDIFTFEGDIGFVGSLRKRKSGKRIIDFSVRTESQEGETENKQIRAFDGLAVFVSRNVRKNQSGVEVQAYGPKTLPTWERDKDTKQWKKTERTGYIAKNVRVPKRAK